MTRSLCLGAAILAAGFRLAAQPQRFSSGVEVVTVDALVTDSSRVPVRGLTPQDFELRDNGALQSIQSISLEALPLRIVLSLDVSASVAGPRLDQLRAAAASIAGRLRPGDRASIQTFTDRVTSLTPMTGDRGQLVAALKGLRGGGGTSLRDAVYAALASQPRAPGRTLVVLFTDGVDTSSFLTDAAVLQAAERSDAIVYPVSAGAPPESTFLRALAAATGGRVMPAEGDSAIGAAFSRILDEFNSRYVLWYTPTGVASGGWHTIDLTMARASATIIARRGYFRAD